MKSHAEIQRTGRSIPAMLLLLLLAGLNLQLGICHAQPYSITWYKIAGGGGTSSNGQYTLSGTIGQPDASSAMTGGPYSLTGGFWALYAVQTPGTPNLSIAFVGPNSAAVSWPNTGSYTLLTNGNVGTTNWTAYTGSVTTTNGTNSVTITPPQGNLFFRLANPWRFTGLRLSGEGSSCQRQELYSSHLRNTHRAGGRSLGLPLCCS